MEKVKYGRVGVLSDRYIFDNSAIPILGYVPALVRLPPLYSKLVNLGKSAVSPILSARSPQPSPAPLTD